MTVVTPQRPEVEPPASTELLKRCTDRIAGKLQDGVWQGSEAACVEALEELELTSSAVEAVLDGRPMDEVAPALSRPVIHGQLLDALRSEAVLADGDEDVDVRFEVVHAIESLASALGGDDADDLRTRLAQPDAFELLVEVAHDLRSPLTSILFLSETLRVGHSGEVNEQQRSQLGLIYSAALGLVSVASDVVDLARNSQGLINGEPEPYLVAEVFRGLEDMVRPMAEEKGVEFRMVVPEHERSHGHPVALGRVLLNLTTNALKFTDQGHVEVGIVRHPRSRLEFYVRDTGRGIPADKQEELFQPFKRRHTRDGHFFSGSGVGLSIARRLVRAMGSELKLETAPDHGTRFSFVLDIALPR